MSELALAVTPNGRSDARTNMFIAAAMTANGASCPVRIRDMSPEGALLETSVAPQAGTVIRLSRGSLMVSGTIIWSEGKRFGLRLNSLVNVRDWMAPLANAGQAQVDAMLARVRATTITPSLHSDELRAAAPQQGLRERLAAVSALIEDLAEALTDDPATVARHGVELQKIDKALQLIAAIQADNHAQKH